MPAVENVCSKLPGGVVPGVQYGSLGAQVVVPAGATVPLVQTAGVALLVDVCDAFPLLVQITLVPTLTLRFAGEKA